MPCRGIGNPRQAQTTRTVSPVQTGLAAPDRCSLPTCRVEAFGRRPISRAGLVAPPSKPNQSHPVAPSRTDLQRLAASCSKLQRFIAGLREIHAFPPSTSRAVKPRQTIEPTCSDLQPVAASCSKLQRLHPVWCPASVAGRALPPPLVAGQTGQARSSVAPRKLVETRVKAPRRIRLFTAEPGLSCLLDSQRPLSRRRRTRCDRDATPCTGGVHPNAQGCAPKRTLPPFSNKTMLTRRTAAAA
jgi:hypothetical protein